MDWRMTLIMVLAIPAVLLVMFPIMRQTGKIGHERQDALANFSGTAEETLSEIRLVKSSNAEPVETTTGARQIKTLCRIGLREAIYDSISSPVMTATMMALFVGVLCVCVCAGCQWNDDDGDFGLISNVPVPNHWPSWDAWSVLHHVSKG